MLAGVSRKESGGAGVVVADFLEELVGVPAPLETAHNYLQLPCHRRSQVHLRALCMQSRQPLPIVDYKLVRLKACAGL